MIFNYVKPTDLAKDIEFGARRVYMRYGQVVAITITNNPITSGNIANLIIKPYNTGTYSTSTKTYTMSLSNFQQITFRDYFPELFIYKEIHETGNETDFLELTQPELDALTAEVNNFNNLELYWITPLNPDYWNSTDTTLEELLTTQFNMLATPTIISPLGTVVDGVIESEIDVDTFHKVAFTTSTEIGKGVYYFGLNKIPTGKVQYKLNGAGSYSQATYVGKYNNQFIYSFYSLEDYTIQLLITSANSFDVKIYSRNPIINYAI